MEKEKSKKGTISIHFLIGMILLVLAVVIILFLYYQFYWKGTINKETCHQSALMRHTFNIGYFEPGRQTVPLRCKTQKICLYEKEKDCGFVGEGVDYIKVENEEEMVREMADQMYDCWSTMGEGFLQLFYRRSIGEELKEGGITELFKGRYLNCITYARIKFSKDLKGKTINLADYLKKKIPNGEISYWDFLASNGKDLGEKSIVLDTKEGTQKFYSELTTDKEYWVLFLENNRHKASGSAILDFPGVFGITGVTNVGDWLNKNFPIIGTGQENLLHSLLLVPSDIEQLERCEEFHEIV